MAGSWESSGGNLVLLRSTRLPPCVSCLNTLLVPLDCFAWMYNLDALGSS